MTTKLDRLVIYVNDLLPVKSYDSLITWCFSISRDKLEQLYSITTVFMTKRGRMVTYLEDLLPIKSYEALIMWSFEIM